MGVGGSIKRTGVPYNRHSNIFKPPIDFNGKSPTLMDLKPSFHWKTGGHRGGTFTNQAFMTYPVYVPYMLMENLDPNAANKEFY